MPDKYSGAYSVGRHLLPRAESKLQHIPNLGQRCLHFFPKSSAQSYLTSPLLKTFQTGSVKVSGETRCLLQPATTTVCPTRTRVRTSLRTGGPRTVKAVVNRFFRLENGLWIRTQAGRAKKLWKKPGRKQHRIQSHIFCNASQCRLLDKMVNRYFKTKKFYVDDPYQPYHSKWHLPEYKYTPPKFLP